MSEFDNALAVLTDARAELANAEKDFENARDLIASAEIRMVTIRTSIGNFETVLRAALPPVAAPTT